MVALVVIGPKDLPKVLRTVGMFISKAREMAREFQHGLDDMVRQSELDELRKTVDSATNFNVDDEIKNAIDPGGSLEKALDMKEIADPGAPLIEPAATESFSPGDQAPMIESSLPVPEPTPVAEVVPVVASPLPADDKKAGV